MEAGTATIDVERPLRHTRGRAIPERAPVATGRVAAAVAVLAVLGALFVGQTWLVRQLFGPDGHWERLLDDRPILSGKHPLHLYHGYLGASSFLEKGTWNCFDPAFQAGYPKTPYFDRGAKPAECLLLAVGGAYHPAAYKIGLALACLLAPLTLGAAARMAGLSGVGVCLAVALAMFLGWGGPCQRSLVDGAIEAPAAAIVAAVRLAAIVSFGRTPGAGNWIAWTAAGCIGWLCFPAFFAGVMALELIWYLSVGCRHRLSWHLILATGAALALAVNVPSLLEWSGSFWVLGSTRRWVEPPARSWQSFWNAELWGGTADRWIGLVALAAAGIGLFLWNRRKERAGARVFGIAIVVCLALATGELLSESLARYETSRLLPAALILAVVPAALAVETGLREVAARIGTFASVGTLATGGLAVFALAGADGIRSFSSAVPLDIGLDSRQQALVDRLAEATSPDARILWEERAGDRDSSQWTVLLPRLIDRPLLGGLDPTAQLEHSYATLTEAGLAGRALSNWTDADLEGFCRRYNVGWVVCRSPGTADRFRRWSMATPVELSAENPDMHLFALPFRSFALRGRARLVRADSQYIAIADLVPDTDGKVVLSLHYQPGMRISPGRIRLERDLDPRDPIPFVRLVMPGPVSQATLSWEPR